MKVGLSILYKFKIDKISKVIYLLITCLYFFPFAQSQESHNRNKSTIENSYLKTIKPSKSEDIKDIIDIENGYYYDNNADGYIDSIFVEANTDIGGGLTNGHVQEILQNAITLPSFRYFSFINSSIVSGGFYIKVTEDKNHNPVTYVTNEDSLQVDSMVLSVGGLVIGKTVPIYDRVAPIIHWAEKSAYLIDFQVDSIPDTLTVKFTEIVTDVTHQEPFLFLSLEENTQYNVRLNRVSHSDNIMKFTVEDFNPVQYMRDGDSIWIQRTDRVGDNVNPINYQNNNNNTRRRLWVERNSFQVDLIAEAVSPYYIGKNEYYIEHYIIDDAIINLLTEQGIFDNLNLSSYYGDYIGMLISVKPIDLYQVFPDYTLKGYITISDKEGNFSSRKNKMAWWDNLKSLVWIWNAKDEFGYNVSPGIYNCYFEIEEVTPSLGYENGGPKQTKQLLVGVKSDNSDCGSCGTSAELAFIPPIGFKLASMVKGRKKWWQKLLEWFRLKKKAI